MNKKEIVNKIKKAFFKNYYYVALIACVLAVGGLVTGLALNENAKKPAKFKPIIEENTPSVIKEEETPKVVTFVMPVDNIIGTLLVYDDSELQYYKTQKKWQAHYGVDYLAEKGEDVKAVKDGVVEKITNDEIWGTTIVILHDNNLRSIYRCLSNNASVLKNQKVVAGQKIGVISDTGYLEADEGSHLHFEMTVDNKNVNPSIYLEENK